MNGDDDSSTLSSSKLMAYGIGLHVNSAFLSRAVETGCLSELQEACRDNGLESTGTLDELRARLRARVVEFNEAQHEMKRSAYLGQAIMNYVSSNPRSSPQGGVLKLLEEAKKEAKITKAELKEEAKNTKTALAELKEETHNTKTALAELKEEAKNTKATLAELKEETQNTKTTLAELKAESAIARQIFATLANATSLYAGTATAVGPSPAAVGSAATE